MPRLSCAILAFTVSLGLSGAMAQPAAPVQPPLTAAQESANDKAKADIASAAREQQRTTAATRQQIQAIRAALRARLATLHR